MGLALVIALGTLTIATDYYVSADGNDTASGLSSATSWKSITKVNSTFATLKPGDKILFKRGDTFYGTLKISAFGASGNPITVGAYGTGPNPVLTGFTTVSGWRPESEGVYSAAASSVWLTSVVTINGAQFGMGRCPHDSWLTFESHSGSESITDTSLSAEPNWTGAEVVINKNGWTIDRCQVVDHSGGTLTYSNLGSTEEPIDGRNYFIQNDIRCLTGFGDWYHDTNGGRLYVYFGATDPASTIVAMASIEHVIYNRFYSNITIDGVDMNGSISSGVEFESSCDDSRIINCHVSFAGEFGITYHGNYGLIENNEVTGCASAGIMEAYGSHVVISGNTVRDIGLVKGAAHRATYSVGIKFEDTSGATVQYNVVENTAYNGISITNFNAPHVVRNNYVNRACPWPELDDGGGIYTCSYSPDVVRTIEGNIILNVGSNAGVNNSAGIYLDETSKHVLVKNNTVAHSGIGIFLHKGSLNTIEGNTSFDNYSQIQFSNWTYTPLIYGNVIHDNIFMAKTESQRALAFYTTYNEIPSFGTSHTNCYARPIADDDTFFIFPDVTETLAQWKTRVYPQDETSFKSNVTTTDSDGLFKFLYNPSQSDKVFPLDAPVVDAKGTKYVGSVTMPPYASMVLMVDPNP